MAIEIVVHPILPNLLVGENSQIYDLSNYSTLSQLYSTSGTLSTSIGETGSYLYNLINVSAAGVSSLNGSSGVILIKGTGNVFVTTNNQTITISGQEGGVSQTVNLSGLISTGNADLRYYPLFNNPSGYLNTLSGLSIEYVLDISGALSVRLTTTGSILNAKIDNFSGYVNDHFSTINYVNFISGELYAQIQAGGGGGSGITSLNNLDGVVNLISSTDSFIFNNTGNNINIWNKEQNSEIYRNISGQITGVRYNADFSRIYRDIDNKITGIYYNNYFKKILYSIDDLVTGVNVIYF